MTTPIVAPPSLQLQTAVVAAPDLAVNIALAQSSGDLAYAQAEAAGLGKPDLWEAYHYTFAEAMRSLGTPMPCACDHCQAHAAFSG